MCSSSEEKCRKGYFLNFVGYKPVHPQVVSPHSYATLGVQRWLCGVPLCQKQSSVGYLPVDLAIHDHHTSLFNKDAFERSASKSLYKTVYKSSPILVVHLRKTMWEQSAHVTQSCLFTKDAVLGYVAMNCSSTVCLQKGQSFYQCSFRNQQCSFVDDHEWVNTYIVPKKCWNVRTHERVK